MIFPTEEPADPVTICPTCGADVAAGRDFCLECGHDITHGREVDAAPTSCPVCHNGEIVELSYGVRQCDMCGYTARDGADS